MSFFNVFKVDFLILITNINQQYIDNFVVLLPSFGKLKDSIFEEALVFRSKELVRLILNNLIGIKRFTIQTILKGVNDRLMVPSQCYRAAVAPVPNQALLILAYQGAV